MPFPPGVGGGRSSGDANIQSYDVITADKAIDESNVGNRMLRSMGWHEGSVSPLNPSPPYLHAHEYRAFFNYILNYRLLPIYTKLQQTMQIWPRKKFLAMIVGIKFS